MIHTKPGFLFIVTSMCLLMSGPTTATAGGWLGVTLIPPQGVQIAEIFKDSPADRSLIKRGDIMLQLDGITIRSIDHFIKMVANIPAGKEVTLAILRKGKALDIKATLENDEEHQSFTQTLATDHWQKPTHGNFTPPPTPSFSGGKERLRTASPFFPPETWESYRPPQERVYRPPLPSAWLGIAPGAAANGIMVMGVAPNSPAEQAELKVGDIITAINRQPITSPKAFVQIIGRMQAGGLAELSFTREGRTQMLQVQLQEPPLHP